MANHDTESLYQNAHMQCICRGMMHHALTGSVHVYNSVCSSGANITTLFTSVQDPSADVRQSAFALVGDLSRVCAPHLQPVLKQLLALAIQNMESHCISLENMSACNNACWSLGMPAALLLLSCQPVQVCCSI